MNYKKIYQTFIQYCQTTNINERLVKRNAKDFRIGKDYIYTEHHHIIPRSYGGNDEKDNLVELLPEEHLIAHKIRWKAFKQRNDMLAVRFCLNGITGGKNKALIEVKNSLNFSKKIKQGYTFMRQNSAEIRKTTGWHTEEGIKRISEARKGTLTVKDKYSNIFSVKVDNERYLSGELVHHTKGFMTAILKETGEKVRITSKEYQNNKDIYNSLYSNKGSDNSNFNHVLDKEKIIELFFKNLDSITENNIFLSGKFNKILVDFINEQKIFKKTIKSTAIVKQKFGSKKALINEINDKYNLNIEYNKNYKSKETRKKLSEYNLNKGK